MVVRKFKATDLHDLASQISPFTIGFDRVFDNLNSVAELSNNYPPYNIADVGAGKYSIEFAAAGFKEPEPALSPAAQPAAASQIGAFQDFDLEPEPERMEKRKKGKKKETELWQ